jgi:hypothetical protein
MARMKLTARKHVRVPLHRDAVPTEAHSDGQEAGYFPRTLRTMLLALGSSEPPLFIGILRLRRGIWYLWRVHVVIYERSTTDHIRCIHQVVEAPAPRWTFEAGMREAAVRHWPSCIMRQMSKWHIRNTATSRAELKKEREL